MTLLSSPRPSAWPGRRAARALVTALAALCAGLLAAACSGSGGQARAAGRGAGRPPATSSAHPAPSVVRPTTPAPRAAPSRHRASPTSPPPTPPGRPAPTEPAGPVPTATAVPAPSSPASGGPQPAPLAECPTQALRIRVGAAGNAAGSVYYALEFTNVSGLTCTMDGYPGVAFVSGPGGGQLGGAAVRNPTIRPALVTLAPGATDHASVQVAVAQNYPKRACQPAWAHWLRVYPPGQMTPRYARLTAKTCTGTIPGGSTLGIYVVRPGVSGL